MTSSTTTKPLPFPSALSILLSSSSSSSPTPIYPTHALALSVLHNLTYQHAWTSLHLHPASSSSLNIVQHLTPTGHLTSISSPSALLIQPPPVPLLSGLPPRPLYTHPDFQAHLLTNDLTEADIPSEREWVLPLSIGETWTLTRFCDVFDALPKREALQGANGFRHQDVKRVILAMVGHQGRGGDGTVVYYVMQEGDVKPRQN